MKSEKPARRPTAARKPASARTTARRSDSTVAEPTHVQIEAIAHAIWEEEGRPEGRADAHWRMAMERLRTDAKPKRARK